MAVTWVTYSLDFAQWKWDVSPGRTLEGCIETFLLDAVKANGFVKPSFRIDILFESDRKAGAEFRLVTLGVERGTTAFRGCERNLSPSILENEVGSSELFEPEARLPPVLPS